MKKAVFYGRYSSANQTEQSIEGQLHVCEKFAAENGIEITAHYIDRAMSATSDKRPQFQQMIADSSHGSFDTVLVYKLDRFARNRYDSAIHKKKLRDNGVRVVSATEPLSDTPEGIILEGMLESIDEYFSQELSRKCKRGLKESCDKGYFICNTVPLGYKKVDRRLEIDPETAPIIRKIFEEYVSGKSAATIANELNEQGLTVNGRAFLSETIRKWLCNEVFVGRFHTGENIVEVPAVIDETVFAKALERKAAARKKYRERRPGVKYYLTGKAFCMKCGTGLCGHPIRNTYNYYWCRECGSHIIQAEPLHDKVKYALYEYLTEDKIKELAAAAYEEYRNSKPEDPTVPLRAELKAVKTKIGNATAAILTGLDSSAVRQALAELEERSRTLENEIVMNEKHSPDLTREHFEYALSRILEYPEEQFEKLVGILVDRVIVSKEQVIICINLTNEANEPPLEQIRIGGTCPSAPSPYAYISLGWLMIAA
jgi:DNA invertase Pin-like site-specific DNA recombinase